MMKKLILLCILCTLGTGLSFSQTGGEESTVDYRLPKEYEIGGITTSGTRYLDESVLITLSGLQVGSKITIPGEDITKAIRNLWKQGLFANVKIYISKTIGNTVFLEIKLKERPRLCSYAFVGIKKQQVEDLREKIRLIRGKVITENLRITTKNIVQSYFREKGYLNTTIEINEVTDTAMANCLALTIGIDKGKKVKIDEITFKGNTAAKEGKLRRLMKSTKQRGFFKILTVSKFNKRDYKEDKTKIIEHYNSIGFRDAKIEWDTVHMGEKGLMISMRIDEGSKYYFRTITWKGNSKFSDEKLSTTLGIEKGEIYDNTQLESRLFMDPNGLDVSSLYMDDGYLFFQATPVEVAVESDSIDIQVQIYEGAQATINEVIITGNTKTNDHVIRRELRTIPGNKFSRTDIIRSQREIASLGYFNPESLGVNPIPHPESGTVDIEYKVEEKPADQVEMSMGWGGIGLVGSFGVSFTNFSIRNIFNADAWRPLPAGDGQRLSVRAQANATFYRSLSTSFTEPWLGGKKANSFTVSLYRSVQTTGHKKEDPNYGQLATTGGSIGLGIRLNWPDDYFILSSTINLQNFDLQNWFSNSFILQEGFANNFSLNENLSRNSLDQPIYPRFGSMMSLSIQATPPYSMFDRNKFKDPNLSSQEKYKWIEYHKYRFTADWYTKIVGNLVLKSSAKFGFLAFYNKDIGPAPFERFEVGGSGLTNFSLYGVDIISSRGYGEFTPIGGATIFDKFTLELRYPLALKPMSTI